jgi:very-short-patch-repair endonuclease
MDQQLRVKRPPRGLVAAEGCGGAGHNALVTDEESSWRAAYEASLHRLAGGEAPWLEPRSIDAYLSTFPLEPEPDEQLNDLHRVALRALVTRHAAWISNDFEMAAQQCASPIERVMLYALGLVAWEWTDGVLLRVEPFGASGHFASSGAYLEIAPQAQIGRYRVDFLLTMVSPHREDPSRRVRARLVVECDGHDWHERTRHQAERDRVRDRALQAEDIAVFRYTGSEIWRDVFVHAYQAVEELARRHEARQKTE